jgi:hypothetical protein
LRRVVHKSAHKRCLPITPADDEVRAAMMCHARRLGLLAVFAESATRAAPAPITALWITTDQVPSVPDRLEQAVSAGELGIDRVTEALIRMASAKRGITNRTR